MLGFVIGQSLIKHDLMRPISPYYTITETWVTLTEANRQSPVHPLTATLHLEKTRDPSLGFHWRSTPLQPPTPSLESKNHFLQFFIKKSTCSEFVINFFLHLKINWIFQQFHTYSTYKCWVSSLVNHPSSITSFVLYHTSLQPTRNLGYVDGRKPSIVHSSPHCYFALQKDARPITWVSLAVYSPSASLPRPLNRKNVMFHFSSKNQIVQNLSSTSFYISKSTGFFNNFILTQLTNVGFPSLVNHPSSITSCVLYHPIAISPKLGLARRWLAVNHPFIPLLLPCFPKKTRDPSLGFRWRSTPFQPLCRQPWIQKTFCSIFHQKINLFRICHQLLFTSQNQLDFSTISYLLNLQMLGFIIGQSPIEHHLLRPTSPHFHLPKTWVR